MAFKWASFEFIQEKKKIFIKVRLGDLRVLFQTEWFYDSMNVEEEANLSLLLVGLTSSD